MNDPNNNNTINLKQLSPSSIESDSISNESNLYFPDPVRSWFSDEQSNLAVRVRNVCLTYGSGLKATYALNNLSLSVPIGTIYGLIGPSGCGKTSLLGIISGLIKPDRGVVKVFGYQPGDQSSGVPDSGLGYMPQDTALQSDLTIGETLWYFGRLNFLPKPILNQRIRRLIQLLDIPEAGRLVASLSGGQQRRVSLACAIIHKPRLAILDEPTVGIDPLICHRIWSLLGQFVQEDGMTIIITTHYIEECRKAGLVGFMRGGEILEEDKPNTLIERYSANSLEDVFFKICYKQKRRNTIIYRKGSCKLTPQQQQKMENFNDHERDYVQPYRSYRSMFPIQSTLLSIMTLTWRYLLQSLRNPIFLALLFVFPIASLAVMYICVGHSPVDVPVGWIIEDKPDYGGLNYHFSANSSTNTHENAYSNYKIPYYPQLISDYIDLSVIKLIPYETLESALLDVKSTKLVAALYMRQSFSLSFYERFDLFNSKSSIDNDTISRGTIWLYADLSNQFMLTVVELSVELALLKIYNETGPVYKMSNQQRALPLVIGDSIEGGHVDMYQLDVSEYVTPGFVITSIFACAFAISSLAFITETKDKMFTRNYSTGLTPSQIVTSQLISRFVFLSINGVIFLFISIFVFKIPCRGSPFFALAMIWFQALAGSAAGIFFGAMFPKFETALFVSLGSLVLVGSISGLFWPVEALPYYIKTINFISPFSEAVVSLRNIMIKVDAPFVSTVLPGFAISIFWLIVYVIGSIFFLKRSMFVG